MSPNQHPVVPAGLTAKDAQYTNTVAGLIETILADSSSKMERFFTVQRIQDIAVIFLNRRIDPDIDFSQEPAARHAALWGSQDAYSAAATWMVVAGPQRYARYLVDVEGHLRLAHEAMGDLGLQTNQWYHRHLAGFGGASGETPAPSSSRPSQRPAAAGPREHAPAPGPAPAEEVGRRVARWMALDGNGHRGLIGGFGEYERCRAAYLGLRNEGAAGGARVVPVPEDDRPWVRAWVRRLHEAILDDRDVIDNARLRPSAKRRRGDDDEEDEDEDEDDGTAGKAGAAGAARRGGQFVEPVAVARVRELKSLEIELLCYDVVRHAWYCQQGQHDIPSWTEVRVAGKRTRSLRAGAYGSLEERLVGCEEALRSSKNCVKQMLMLDFAKRLAYNPDGEVKRKRENKLVNGKRDLENKAGKFARAAGLVVFQDDRSIVTAGGGRAVAPAHPLTSRMATATARQLEDGAAADAVVPAGAQHEHDQVVDQSRHQGYW